MSHSTDNNFLEYHPESVNIADKKVPKKIRWTLHLIVVFIIGIIVWSIIGQVDRIVTAPGILITTSSQIVVQPLSTSVINAINVKVGDEVKKGQVLASLDHTFAKADLRQVEQRAKSINLQLRRLKCELNNISFTTTPEDAEEGGIQQHIFNLHSEIISNRKQLTTEKLELLNAKLFENNVKQTGFEKNIKILREIELITGKQPLNLDQNRIKILTTQRERTSAENEFERLKASRNILQKELNQIESEFKVWYASFLNDLIDETVKLHDEKSKLLEEISKANRINDLIELRAPQDAIVLEIADRYVGSVIKQAEPLFTLMPKGAPLIAEVRVKAKDIGRIRQKDKARMKLAAFPFQKHSTLTGEISVISENSFKPENASNSLSNASSNMYYKVRINIIDQQLSEVPETFRLIPGMSLIAEMKVGTRSIITYFLYPIIRYFDESIREP